MVVCALAAPLAAADESAWPALEIANFIDARVFERLREQQLVPSQLAGDAEFLRRLSLTTIGQLPTPDEVRGFLADDGPDKRARKIDELLAHKLHAALWATRFSELTGNSLKTLEGPDALKPKRAKMWHDWLRKRFAENTPYDDLVRQILTATSRGDADVDRWIDDEAALTLTARGGFGALYAERAGFDLFWRRDEVDGRYPAEEIAERVASSFLGVRINCARCHKHPFDRWTQEDYRAFAGIFAQVRFDLSPEVRSRYAERIDERRRRAAGGGEAGPPLPRIREVYLAAPASGASAAKAKALGGSEFSSSRDPRAALMDWLNDPANPYFAKNIVNRVWAHHFGRGLVEPLDGFSADNRPSHPALIDELAADFIAHGYDLRRLETLILNSSSWQLSSEPNAAKGASDDYFARALVRLPPAETVLDMWLSATGTAPDFGHWVPAEIRAVEIGPSRLGKKRWDDFLDLFGRSARSETCDCAPKQSPSIRQTLALMCDTNLLADVSHGAHRAMLQAALRGDSLIDEMFLRTLSRFPTGTERASALDAIAAASNKHQAFEDLFWGLINSQEFITNH
jgi:hypothetical protein